jgi:hypothetical protein
MLSERSKTHKSYILNASDMKCPVQASPQREAMDEDLPGALGRRPQFNDGLLKGTGFL